MIIYSMACNGLKIILTNRENIIQLHVNGKNENYKIIINQTLIFKFIAKIQKNHFSVCYLHFLKNTKKLDF